MGGDTSTAAQASPSMVAVQRFEDGGYLFYLPGPPGQSGTIFAVSDGGGFSDEAWAQFEDTR